jgi:MFS transporter, AAHS family, 4-hydroxybenzoate transporter
VGLYSLAAKLYPTQIRATGIGGAVGVGRIGAIIGPLLGGILIGIGLTMSSNFIIFAVPTLLGGVIVLLIKPSTVS